MHLCQSCAKHITNILLFGTFLELLIQCLVRNPKYSDVHDWYLGTLTCCQLSRRCQIPYTCDKCKSISDVKVFLFLWQCSSPKLHRTPLIKVCQTTIEVDTDFITVASRGLSWFPSKWSHPSQTPCACIISTSELTDMWLIKQNSKNFQKKVALVFHPVFVFCFFTSNL